MNQSTREEQLKNIEQTDRKDTSDNSEDGQDKHTVNCDV